jgi:tRNA-2-methylthio-N6-dimethylallyladenosine synthase
MEASAADVVLLNTCSVREHAEQRVISRVGQLNHRRQQGRGPQVVGICGCMAQRLGQRLLAAGGGVDIVIGVDQYDRLPSLLRELLGPQPSAKPVLTAHRPEVHYVASPEFGPLNNSHLVTIHKGCDYGCTYCIVPATRGAQREKDPELILAEIRAILAGGGCEVTLLGQNVTAYNWQGTLDLAGLLQRVAALAGLRRVRFLTGHPRDLSDRLLEVIASEDKICPALHLPMQSGSDRVLKRMKRLYTRDQYLALVAKARARIADVTFSSDFIVGFPGETERDFAATLEVIRQVGYDQVFAFKYSPRPGAPAASLPDDVPLAEKKRRLAAVFAVQREVWQATAERQIGAVWPVVVEAPARRPAGAWKARTPNNRKVLLGPRAHFPGRELMVRITGFQNTTFRGEPLADVR